MSKNKSYRNKKQIKITGGGECRNLTHQQWKRRRETDSALPGFIFRINPTLLQDAIKNNWLNDLAFFYHLKYRFTNGEIYKRGDTYARLAAIYNTSPKTIYRRFKALKRQGLIIPAPDRYLLKGNPKQRYRKVITATSNPDTKEIKYLLLSQPIEAAYIKQARNLRVKQACEQVGIGTKEPATSKRSETFYASLSVRYIAKLLNISVGQAHALKTAWQAMGIIDVRNQDAKRVSNVIMPDFAAKMVDACEGIDYGHRFNYNQHLCEHQPAKVAFTLRPVTVKPVTPKEWKRLNKDVKVRELIIKYRAENTHWTKNEQHVFKAI